MVKKVNIDELVQLLLDMRQTAEYVDIQIAQEDNTLRVRRHIPMLLKPKDDNETLDIDDINDLIV